MARKIIQFSHPSEPQEFQMRNQAGYTPREILDYLDNYQKWHTRVFGESEAQQRTKGRKIWNRTKE
jgi:hypothetical protein